jgi:hypothetical protein
MLGCYPALPHGIEIGSQHPVAPSIKTPTPASQSRAYNRVSHILEGHTELFVSGIILPVMRLYDTLSLPAPTTRFLRRRTHFRTQNNGSYITNTALHPSLPSDSEKVCNECRSENWNIESSKRRSLSAILRPMSTGINCSSLSLL